MTIQGVVTPKQILLLGLWSSTRHKAPCFFSYQTLAGLSGRLLLYYYIIIFIITITVIDNN